MFESKYFLQKNVRISKGEGNPDEVTCIMNAYDTSDEAEVAYYDEVKYGINLGNTVILAHYRVVDEFGNLYRNLERIINHVPVEETEPKE